MLAALRKKITRIRTQLAHKASGAADGDSFGADELGHAAEAMRLKDVETAENTIRLGIAFNATLFVIVPAIALPEHKPVLLGTASFCLLLDLFWVLGMRKVLPFLKAHHVIVGGNLLLIAAFSQVVAVSVGAAAPMQFALATNGLMTLASILLILSPFNNYLTPLTAASFWAITFALYPPSPSRWRWLILYGVGLGFSTAVWRMQSMRTRREAILEYRSRQAEIRAASMRFQRDLELAREIQDSMAPPAHSVMPEGSQIYCMQMKYEKIAGDWMTVRRFPDHSLVMVCVDATGKGMQAALVVHAIQSLWATTMDDDSFDAKKWLLLVNQALSRLGEKQAHSATAGVAVIKGNRITYWSAGHLPLFLLLGHVKSAQLKTLMGKGNILGVGSVLALAPQYIDVAPTLPIRIVLASDGVLEKGTLTQAKDLESLYEGMQRLGAGCLTDLPSQDDKSLILLERNLPQTVARAS